MEKEIKAYGLAVQEHIDAVHAETAASIRVKRARQILFQAKQDLWAKEHELLEIRN